MDEPRDESEPPVPGAATRAVHAGERQAVPRRAATVPVHHTAPFLFDSAADLEQAFAGVVRDKTPAERNTLYSRYGNPSVRVVEEKLAALEGAGDAVAFASGMAAIAAVFDALLAPGDRLLVAADLYGGTLALLRRLEARRPSITVEWARLGDLTGRLADRERPAPRLVYLETPTNPLLGVCDLAAVAREAAARGALLVVDNTFATPVLQNPLALGAQVVVHSATKYLAGHSDVTAGLVAASAELIGPVREVQMVQGACLDPHAAFLVARGMRTLALRIERQAVNAERLARFLSTHPRVKRVYYPGFDGTARRQMRSGGAMLSFDLAVGPDGALAAARGFLDRLRVFQIIPSLGGVESGAILPALTSHRGLTAQERRAAGIGDGLVRLSVGIEDPADLERDLARALEPDR
jgi:cystathionine beta-lyase/cystathionine gamma-synthase